MPGQAQINYTYDSANRLTQITQGTASTSIGYDNDNRRTSLTLPNGVVATYAFDNASQLTAITYASGATTVGTLTYGYDQAGRITSRGGTLFQSVLPTAVSSATYDTANRLTARTAAGVTTTPTWDLNGSLTNDGLRGYTWDARNRLTAITGLASFVYDGAGRRQTKTISGTGTSYLYDGFDVVQEQQSGTASANLLTGLGVDERFSRTSTGTASTYLTDALGSTVALASSTGTIQTSYGYDPYGVTTTSGAANTSPYQFTGREADATGLYYNRARYYNPAWARFISEDPIGLRGGINRYAYVGNDPLDNIDPFGLQCLGCHNGPIFPGLPFPWAPLTPPASPSPSAAPGGPPPPYGSPGNPPKWCNLPSQMCADMPLDKGGRRWAQKNGYPSDAGQRAAHDAKNADNMHQPADDYRIDPDTGEVYDPNGDPIGNAGDYINQHL